MSVGIILVHGYTGSSGDLRPLYDILLMDHGSDSVTNITLPGHCTSEIPPFDIDQFVEITESSVNKYLKEKRKIILIGHSTGGTIILSYLARNKVNPHLLILVSVPKKINTDYIERWKKHSSEKLDLPLIYIAKMVSSINNTGLFKFNYIKNVVILHGENDPLVLKDDSIAWQNESFPVSSHLIIVPSSNHQMFLGPNSEISINLVRQFILDSLLLNHKNNKITDNMIYKVEPQLKEFLEVSPLSYKHIMKSPGCKKIIAPDLNNTLSEVTEPIIANIEITTYCNLKCRFCARTHLNKNNSHMLENVFKNILGLLPHVYRINLVGLGEPLLHPNIVDFISLASSRNRRVSLVTNAMCLDKNLSKALIKSGLDSITFSIDGPDQTVLNNVRNGSDFNRISDNIYEFMKAAKGHSSLSTSVFCALSIENISFVNEIIDVVSKFGVDALIFTDINFDYNINSTLWNNFHKDKLAIVRGAIGRAFSNDLPVLSLRALEEFGLKKRYLKFLLLRPNELFMRSKLHTNCFSPWQTIPVSVNGDVTLCDCQPAKKIGNILNMPLSKIWYSDIMQEHRKKMVSNSPPKVCSICPRF